MQLGESVSVGTIADVGHDESCYFCKNRGDPKSETNELTDDPDEDGAELEGSLGEYRFKNNAGKLGDALGGKPGAKHVTLGGGTYDASVAAHHLIPGNASLRDSDLMPRLKIDGTATGNIAYNVNSKPNGVWLVGNYGVRPWGEKGEAFQHASGVQPEQFAFAAINAWRGQFHDAHEKYSEFVIGVLNEIADKIADQKNIRCPESKDKGDQELGPFYSLVARLNTVSARMRQLVTFPTKNWKPNVYTSAWVLDYVREMPHQP